MKTKLSRIQQCRWVMQSAVFIFVCTAFITYRLYISGFIGFKLTGISALNPFAGYDTMFLWVTESFYRPNFRSFALILAGVILVFPVFSGRFFCGWICPFGTLQDFFSYLGYRWGKSLGVVSSKWNQRLEFTKYGVLALIIATKGVFGSSILTSWDPWTAFANLPVLPLAVQMIPMAFLVLALALGGAFFLERFFCRYLCPLGALQGLVSLIGVSRFARGKGCSGCGHCHAACPVGIQLEGEENLYSPECINCLKCVEQDCQKSQGFQIFWGKKNFRPPTYMLISLLLFTSSLYILRYTGSYLAEKEYEVVHGEKSKSSITLYQDGNYQGKGRGFAPGLEVRVQINKGKISSIDVIEHQETWGYYEETIELLSQKMVDDQSPEVDVITGATYTGKGLKEAVKNALTQAVEVVEDKVPGGV